MGEPPVDGGAAGADEPPEDDNRAEENEAEVVAGGEAPGGGQPTEGDEATGAASDEPEPGDAGAERGGEPGRAEPPSGVGPGGDELDTVETPAEAPTEPETGLIGLLQSRGPQKAVLVLGGLVVALFLMVAWLVVAGGNGDEDEDEVEAADSELPATSETTEPPETTTTVPETTTTTLSPEEEAELEVIEAYEAALDAVDEASAAPEPDPEHPALEETHTDPELQIVTVDIEVLARRGTAIRYPEDSVREVEVQEVSFSGADGSEMAVLAVCEVTDREEVLMETGAVLAPGSGLRTLEHEVEMHRVDDTWQVAAIDEVNDREEGVGGCALD